MANRFILPALGLLLVTSAPAMAEPLEDCVAQRVMKASDNKSMQSIRASCEKKQAKSEPSRKSQIMDCLRERALTATDDASAASVRQECKTQVDSGKEVPKKFAAARSVEMNPDVISPLRQNYILPYTYNSSPNQESYQVSGDGEPLDNEEAKLQISLKVPLTYQDLLTPNDGIYFGFTLKSFWQVYNHDISAPFRETNYRPEIFYLAPLPIEATRGTWFGRVGLEHESNGRTQLLSRSWNRAYVTLGYAEADWALAIQPWYRFPEEKKFDDGDPATPPESEGDDNPDIEDYMGYYEMNGAYRWGPLELSGMFRRNFAQGHGAYELGLSFPLWGRLRGYTQYFDGYGESLIDYNHKNQRIGVGVLLTEMF